MSEIDDLYITSCRNFLLKYYSPHEINSLISRITNPLNNSDLSFSRKVNFFINENAAHDYCSDIIPDDVNKFDRDCFQGYLDENIVFIKYPYSFIQRKQRDFLCYIQAASVVQHYAVCIQTGTKTKTLDINSFVRSTLSPVSIRSHLEGVGTSSEYTLTSILDPSKNDLIACNDIDFILHHLKTKHVAMISKFPVLTEFSDENRFHYHGIPQKCDEDGDQAGRDRLHAMCIVGYRESEENGIKKVYFLLQNWWSKKQFIEIDDVYFVKSKGVIVYFIKDEQSEIPSSFPQLDGNYFEAAEGADSCEGEACEDQ